MLYYKLCFILLGALTFTQTGFCQVDLLELKWEEEEEFFYAGNLHRISCTFKSATDQKGKLIIKPDPILKLLSPSSYKINAKQGKVNLSTAKLYLPQIDTNDKDILKVQVIVQSMEGTQDVIARQELAYAIKERVVIRMEALQNQIPIKETDSLVTIPLRIKNMGKRAQDIALVLQKKPVGLRIDEMQKILAIRPSQDTVIRFAVEPERDWKKVHTAVMKYDLNLTENNENITDCRISAFPMGKTKKYFNPGFANNNKHTLKTGMQARGNSNNTLDFYGTGRTPLFNGNINYQIQSFYYTQERKVELRNSNVEYYDPSKSILMGQLNYNDEAYLTGRGILYETGKDSQSVHLGFINGAQSLFTSNTGLNTLTGNSVVGGFSQAIRNFGTLSGNGLLKFRTDSRSGLFWFSNSIDKKKEIFHIRLGFSGIQYPNQSKSLQPGIGLNVEYEKEMQRWNFQTNGHYYSPQYEGSIPGNIYTYNKLTYLGWKNIAVSTTARMRNSRTTVQKENRALLRNSMYQNYQIQFETKSKKLWKFLVAPYQIFETRNFIDYLNPEQFYYSRSTRLRSTIYRKKGSLIFSLTNDVGQYSFGDDLQNQTSSLTYDVNFNLSNRSFNVNSGYRKGTINLPNAYEFNRLDKTNTDFYLSTRWAKWLFNGKIKANLSNQISYNNIRKIWTSASLISLRSVLPDDFTVNTTFSFLNTLYSNSHFWRLSLTKKIDNYRSANKAKKLRLTLFEDINNNGQLDQAEQTLSGIFVKVNEVTLVTGSEGSINYKGLPAGEYRLSFVDPTGAYAGKRQIINLTEDIIQNVPLYKTIPLKGKVKELKQRFKRSKFTLLGIPVLAKNIQGEIVTTYTQDDGSFYFNLPKNEYVIYIDDKAFGENFDFPDNYQKVRVTGKALPGLSFSVKVKSRKMTIKKF